MKRSIFVGFFILIALLLMTAVPVSAYTTTIAGDKVNTVSPTVLSRDTTTTVTITGVNFTVQQGSVLLAMPGENDITTVTISSWTPSQIICKIRITASKELGKWDLVVFKGFDNTKIVKADAIAITEEMSLTAITPTSGQADDDDVDFTLTGENFDEDTIDSVYLYNQDYDNITADDVDVASSTKITGTFDLDGADEDTYDVCIEDTYGNVFCDLSFEITTNEVGSIDVSSNPSGAQILIDGVLNGTTPDTIDDVVVGSHRIILRKTGYQEWGKMVTVEADETTEVEATLYAITTYTATQPPTTWVTARPTTARTTAKSTIKVPTTWAYVPTTAASPLDPLVVIGATGAALGLVLLRRR